MLFGDVALDIVGWIVVAWNMCEEYAWANFVLLVWMSLLFGRCNKGKLRIYPRYYHVLLS